MRPRTAVLASLLVLLPGSSLLGQAEVRGHYITSAGTIDTTHLADGRMLVRQVYPMAVFTDSDTGLFNKVQNRCASWSVAEPEMPETATAPLAGDCFGLDADGDSYWFWWRADEAGTQSCPMLCGSWSLYLGTGKYEGLSGTGTWKVATQFSDGSNRGTFSFRRR